VKLKVQRRGKKNGANQFTLCCHESYQGKNNLLSLTYVYIHMLMHYLFKVIWGIIFVQFEFETQSPYLFNLTWKKFFRFVWLHWGMVKQNDLHTFNPENVKKMKLRFFKFFWQIRLKGVVLGVMKKPMRVPDIVFYWICITKGFYNCFLEGTGGPPRPPPPRHPSSLLC
jgi:hypothetical protein